MKNEKGFSLIELSIVLIIIGLLVSGITGGASLINSARVRATMGEVTSYRIAVNTYYSAKDYYPGDESGDKDGMIIDDEMVDTWTELEAVNAVDKDYTAPTAGAAYVSLTGLGYTKNASAGWLMAYYDGTGTYDYNAIALTDLSDTNTVTDILDSGIVAGATGNLENGTTGVNAGSMDVKMDDGTIDSGNVVSVSSDVTACTYADTTEECVPIFSIDL